MNGQEIIESIRLLRQGFLSRRTLPAGWRKDALRRLRRAVVRHEKDIIGALAHDLHKSDFESYATEIGIVLRETRLLERKLAWWARPERRRSPLAIWPSKSRILKEPYGVVLVIAPWNYPFQLLFNPLAAAVAAGNCVALKTSPLAPATAQVTETIVGEVFRPDEVAVFHGHREVNETLLARRFDYIFFTGSPAMGRVVMAAAAKSLTPVTLELGGKSPCIVDEDANLTLAARRILWGKTLNSGQTCIAPDYLFVHHAVKSRFLAEVRTAVSQMYGPDPQQSPDYPRIVSDKAMQRLISYLAQGDVALGGNYDVNERYIEPTILDNVSETAPIMQEEIFGPIFPMMTFHSLDEVIAYVRGHEKPLALYYFSKDKAKSKRILRETYSGGACINDTIVHIVGSGVPFGGVGNSGMGRYHGKFGFDTFTHLKSVVASSSHIDVKIKYPPYRGKLRKFKKFL